MGVPCKGVAELTFFGPLFLPFVRLPGKPGSAPPLLAAWTLPCHPTSAVAPMPSCRTLLIPNFSLPSCPSPPPYLRYLQSLNASLVYFDRPEAQYCPCTSWTGNAALAGAVGEVASSSPMVFYLEYAPPAVPEAGGGGHHAPAAAAAAGEGHAARRATLDEGGHYAAAPAAAAGEGHAAHRAASESGAATTKTNAAPLGRGSSAADDEVVTAASGRVLSSEGAVAGAGSGSAAAASVASSDAAGPAAEGNGAAAAVSSAGGHGATAIVAVSTTEAPAVDGENPVRAALDGVPVLVPAYTSGSPLALGVLLYDMYR